ncbi:MAG: hypothetical protein ACK4Y7_04850 [Caldimicrobium sp.]
MKDILTNRKKDDEGILNIDANGDTIPLRRDILISELDQIIESKTKEMKETSQRLRIQRSF